MMGKILTSKKIIHMTLNIFRNATLSVVLCSVFLLASCQKDNDDIKKQLAELSSRVTNIESQLGQINKDLVILQEQGKLNADEVASLKILTANLTTITNELKSSGSVNTTEIDKLRAAITNSVTIIQFEQLKVTLNALSNVVSANGVQQSETAQLAAELDKVINDIREDLISLKDDHQIAMLDRPIELKVSKGSFGNKIVLTWMAMPLAKNYQIFRFDEKSNAYVKVGEGAQNEFSDFTSFEPYKKVFYKVRVMNAATIFSNFSDVDYGYASGKNYTKILSFGSEGPGPGQFSFALHVQVDASDNIYVSDEGNNRVQKFDMKGNYKELYYQGSGARAMGFLKNGNAVLTRTQSSSYIQIFNSEKTLLREWGTQGTGDTQFGNIEEIAVDDEDNIYVVDGINNYIKKFSSDGKFLLKFQGATTVEGQSDGPYPYGICIMNNKVFVTSPRNGLIRIFDKQGKFLSSWDLGVPAYAIKAFNNNLYICAPDHVVKTGENGEVREKIGQGDLLGPIAGLAISSEEEIIVSDVYKRFIVVFKKI